MNDNNSVVLNIKDSNNNNKNYFCSYCNKKLVPLTQEDKVGGYLCVKCTIEYWPTVEPVKKQSKFDLPGPETDSHGNIIGDNTPIIATIDPTDKQSSTAYYGQQQKLSPSFEVLKKQGFHFKSYEEK